MSDSPRGVERERSLSNKKRSSSVDRDRSRSRDRNPERKERERESTTQIFVTKLHRNTNESDLKEAFSKFGKIKDISMKRGYAFIDFEEPESAEKSVKEMHRKTFVNGEELVVEESGRE